MCCWVYCCVDKLHRCMPHHVARRVSHHLDHCMGLRCVVWLIVAVGKLASHMANFLFVLSRLVVSHGFAHPVRRHFVDCYGCQKSCCVNLWVALDSVLLGLLLC